MLMNSALEVDVKSCFLAGFTFNVNLAAIIFDHLTHGEEGYTGALHFGTQARKR